MFDAENQALWDIGTSAAIGPNLSFILRSNIANAMNFRIGLFNIQPRLYREAADDIDAGKLRVVIRKFDSDVGAEYSRAYRHLRVSNLAFGYNIEDMGYAFHETTHYITDLIYHSYSVPNSLNEAAAYIAEQTCHQYFGIDESWSWLDDTSLLKWAATIAKSVIKKPGYIVPAAHEKKLRDAILTNKHYAGKG